MRDTGFETRCSKTLMRMMFAPCLFFLFASFSLALGQGQWTIRAPMLTSRTEVAAVALGAKVVVMGRFARNGEIVEEYDAAKDQWRRRASLPYALHHVGAAAVRGKIYVIGGYSAAGQPLDSVLEFDPALVRRQKRSPMPTPRAALAVGTV